MFSVNENNSLVLQAALDRESTSSYDITVTVKNTATCYIAGGGECSSTAAVVVMVTDENDNNPRFTSQSYSGGMELRHALFFM